ncbi:MAG TPA: hypothetical protein GXZ32_05580 [Clostridiales bacterium]|nr:hypothetical protein [Clostridiales bacterium]
MRIVFLAIVVILNYYHLTYSKYLWTKGQKKQALGVFFLIVFSVLMFGIYTFSG